MSADREPEMASVAAHSPVEGDGVAAPAAGDTLLLEALRSGDENAFLELIERYHEQLVRLAMVYVTSRAVAEEVAQDTWLAVLKGIERFESRSSLRTWIFRIASYQARSRGERERRQIPLSGLLGSELDEGEASVEPDRFFGPDHPRWAGGWMQPPASWGGDVEGRLLAGEARDVIERTMAELPRAQGLVMLLRDVQGWSSEEVCAALDLSPGNQRVLLHRARSRVRAALERYLSDDLNAA